MFKSTNGLQFGVTTILNAFILCALTLSCKNSQGAQLGSYFDEVATLSANSGSVRAITGQLDFELPNGAVSSTGASVSNVPKNGSDGGQANLVSSTAQPTDSPSVTLSASASPSSQLRASADGISSQATTLRMQFSIVLDNPVPSLKDLASSRQRMRRVGSLNTFNVVHEPSNARKEAEIIGRPMFISVSAECQDTCIRLVTGEGKLTDKKDVFIIELQESGSNWNIKWFNYFGAEVKNFGLPIKLVNLDKFDGQ